MIALIVNGVEYAPEVWPVPGVNIADLTGDDDWLNLEVQLTELNFIKERRGDDVQYEVMSDGQLSVKYKVR